MKSEKRPIEIEDLLRLKRAERPPAEFWTQFDRELRAKQLAALVAKRPWWQSLPRVFSGLSRNQLRYHLPLGAAAVLTVTFFTARDFPTSAPVASVKPAASTSRAAVTDAAPAAAMQRETAVADFAPAPAVTSIAAESATSVTVPVAAVAEVASATEPVRSLLLGSTGADFELGDRDARLAQINSGLTITKAVEPAMGRGLLTNATSNFEARAMPARATVDPLQQMTPPGERSRSRLLTAMVSMTSLEAPARTGERIADRISEERLYDQVHRFDARGAGVSMKF